MAKNLAKFFVVPVFLAALWDIFFPKVALAATSVEEIIQTYLGVTFGGPCSTEEITGIFCVVGKMINYLLGIVGAVALVMFVVGGLQYMVAGGDEKAITTAKNTITYSVMGLFIVLLASVIVSTILSVIGFSG